MAGKKSDAATAADRATAETGGEENIKHFITALAKDAKREKKDQRKVLSSFSDGKRTSERVLIVKPDGSHKIEEKTK